jgi:hypothetical protein
MYTAFSTGSQLQYPPKFSVSYAQYIPIAIPIPNIKVENKVQGNASLIHELYCFVQSPDIQNEKGIAVDANPRNNVGGCIIIQ